MVLNAILNPVLGPLLALGDFWAIVIITFVLSLIITVVYKYVTNQEMMKQLKTDLKKLQLQAKEHRKDPDRMLKIQKEMMDKNMVLMRHSFKPTLITFIPLILIMGWLQSNMASDSLLVNGDFLVTVQTDKDFTGTVEILETPNIVLQSAANQTVQNRQAEFTLRAPEGLHTVQFRADGTQFSTDIRVGGKGAVQQNTAVKRGGIRQVIVAYPKNVILDLGFWKVGWIGSYIILSIIFSFALRKLMKVY